MFKAVGSFPGYFNIDSIHRHHDRRSLYHIEFQDNIVAVGNIVVVAVAVLSMDRSLGVSTDLVVAAADSIGSQNLVDAVIPVVYNCWDAERDTFLRLGDRYDRTAADFVIGQPLAFGDLLEKMEMGSTASDSTGLVHLRTALVGQDFVRVVHLVVAGMVYRKEAHCRIWYHCGRPSEEVE